MLGIIIKILFLLLVNYKSFGLWNIKEIFSERFTRKIKWLFSISYITLYADEKIFSKISYFIPIDNIYQFHNIFDRINSLIVESFIISEYCQESRTWISSFLTFCFYVSGTLSFILSFKKSLKNCLILGIINTISLDYCMQTYTTSILKFIMSSLIFLIYQRKRRQYSHLNLYDLYKFCHLISFFSFILYLLGLKISKLYIMKCALSGVAQLACLILIFCIYIYYLRDICRSLDVSCPEIIQHYHAAAIDRENLYLKIIFLYSNFILNLISMILLYDLITIFVDKSWVFKEELYFIGAGFTGFILNYPESEQYDLWEKVSNFLGVYSYLLILKYWFNNYIF
ncbi:unnamed protein product [Blepharisma stoltei]|uniref:Microsporidial 8TM transmembrane domain-containing protein n=1 Tax=Blepharisma stoltei TaxID=1481888 RepID=A0AAU9KAC2_9CILI|nr:unnamed protein product [Blepharisma stoltei]